MVGGVKSLPLQLQKFIEWHGGHVETVIIMGIGLYLVVWINFFHFALKKLQAFLDFRTLDIRTLSLDFCTQLVNKLSSCRKVVL
jgi:hypothetical protein